MESHKQMGANGAAQTALARTDLDDVEREILLAVRAVNYGSVEVTIHDSKVVQIERKEKRRFDQR